MTYDEFKESFMPQVEKYAPLKRETIRANNSQFINKALSKSIMIRSRLESKYNKNPSTENINSYKKQRNHCVKLLKLSKKKFYNNLNPNFITDNKNLFFKINKEITIILR